MLLTSNANGSRELGIISIQCIIVNIIRRCLQVPATSILTVLLVVVFFCVTCRCIWTMTSASSSVVLLSDRLRLAVSHGDFDAACQLLDSGIISAPDKVISIVSVSLIY